MFCCQRNKKITSPLESCISMMAAGVVVWCWPMIPEGSFSSGNLWEELREDSLVSDPKVTSRTPPTTILEGHHVQTSCLQATPPPVCGERVRTTELHDWWTDAILWSTEEWSGAGVWPPAPLPPPVCEDLDVGALHTLTRHVLNSSEWGRRCYCRAPSAPPLA